MNPLARWWRQSRFRTKLGLSFLALILLQSALELGADRKFSGELVGLHARDRINESLTALRAAQALMFDNEKLRALDLTREPRFKAVVKLNDGPTLAAQLRELLGEHRAVVALFLRPDGTMAASAARPASLPVARFASQVQRLVNEALAGSPAASWLLWADRPLLTVTVPVEVDGALAGTLSLGLELGDAALANLRELSGADILLFTPQRILRQTVPLGAEADGRLRALQPVAGTRLPDPTPGQIELDGRSYFVPRQPTVLGPPEDGLLLTVLLPADEYLASARSLISEAIGRNVVAVLVIVLLLTVLVARATRPIGDLQTGAERLAAGDLAHRVPVQSGDELGRLAETFNTMAARLAAASAGLERQVAERTANLEAEISRREAAEQELKEHAVRLEDRVRERTAEIEQALATLDGIEDAALIFDAETMAFTYVNQGACNQLGYAREELLGRRVSSVVDPATPRTLSDLLTAARNQAPASVQALTQHRRRDGRMVPVEIRLQCSVRGGSRPVFISVARDITERRALEERQHRDQRLEAIGAMAGGIAHDLNNALAPITIGIEILREKYPGEAEIVDILDQASRRGAGMIRQLLTFAKGHGGERVRLQPGRLVNEVAQMARGTFPKRIRVEVEVAPDLGQVDGDGTQLLQVLLNLSVNARDAMAEGGLLRIEARNADVTSGLAGCVTPPRAGRYVQWVVRDSGTGIPPEVLGRIFDPFFTTKAAGQGTGLGLASVLRIVQGHGGFLRVDTKVGRGSAFEVFLPLAETPVQEASAPAPEPAAVRGKGEMILIVDDEDSIREITRTVLVAAGFRVTVAADGVEALALIAEHGHDIRVVITDLDMPRMGGRPLIDALERSQCAARIVVASGTLAGNEEDVLRSDQRIRQVLPKPFSQGDLLQAVRGALGAGQPTRR